MAMISDDAAGEIQIGSTDLCVTISPLGAELRRIVNAAGDDLLWDGDPTYWTGRAPLLFPIIGGLRDGAYRVDGKTYCLPKHGFARHSRFARVSVTADAASFRLTDTDETRAVYPFAFVLDILYRVRGDRLTIEAIASNPGDRPLPLSFGFHPALRWPLPYRAARRDHVVRFDQAEPEDVRGVTPDGLIAADPLPTPVQGDLLPLTDALFAVDAVVFDAPASRGLWYGGIGTPGVRVAFPDMPQLALWTKPGAGYLCIEPWQGHADPEGYAGQFRDKPGIVEVPPGGERRFAMTMTFGVADPGEGAALRPDAV